VASLQIAASLLHLYFNFISTRYGFSSTNYNLSCANYGFSSKNHGFSSANYGLFPANHSFPSTNSGFSIKIMVSVKEIIASFLQVISSPAVHIQIMASLLKNYGLPLP
jgi:hypothetical protein